ncbi:MAG: serine/threonine protein kinase [Verrucomicrobiia bacterium]
MRIPESAWGDRRTHYFYGLTPDLVLDAVETSGCRCTGRCFQLNSMENRVFEAEIEPPPGTPPPPGPNSYRIAKFYRPGRWSPRQIQDEHQFLADLCQAEIPTVAPLPLASGHTLGTMPGTGILYAIFPKISGRSPDELNPLQIDAVGRLLARLHNVGATRPAPARLTLNPETYGLANLDALIESRAIPTEFARAFANVVDEICDRSFPWFDQTTSIRLHGDAHLGNLLWNDQGPFWVDFDDMINGPAIQDLWLIVPGRDPEARAAQQRLLNAYRTMRHFDHAELRLIEPLRALRHIHFSAWIHRRWADPAFQRKFEFFGTKRYWQQQLADLREILSLLPAD